MKLRSRREKRSTSGKTDKQNIKTFSKKYILYYFQLKFEQDAVETYFVKIEVIKTYQHIQLLTNEKTMGFLTKFLKLTKVSKRKGVKKQELE